MIFQIIKNEDKDHKFIQKKLYIYIGGFDFER